MDGLRDLTGDPAGMRALAHPVRLALLELLGSVGPLTATEAGERLGQAPGNMSWHLRLLARHGFIVEAEGAKGRRRPWTLAAAGHRVGTDARSEEEQTAANALTATVVERNLGQLRGWLARRYSAPEPWRKAAVVSDWTLFLTAEETGELRDQVHALFEAFSDRLGDPSLRPEGAQPVKAMFVLHPEQLPVEEA